MLEISELVDRNNVWCPYFHIQDRVTFLHEAYLPMRISTSKLWFYLDCWGNVLCVYPPSPHTFLKKYFYLFVCFVVVDWSVHTNLSGQTFWHLETLLVKNRCERKLGRCWRCFTLFSTPRHALSDWEQPMHLISFLQDSDWYFFLCKRLGLIGRMSPSFGLWFSFCFHTSTSFDLRESHCFSHVCWISVLRIIFTCKK